MLPNTLRRGFLIGLHSGFVTPSPFPLASALSDSFRALRATRWAGEVPVDSFEEFLREDAARIYRGTPEHFTASAMIFSPDLTHTLLCFHGKGNMWVQLGGHMEDGDSSPAAGALREAAEESGLGNFELLSPAPIDLNHHGLAQTFGSCHAHWDVVFALTVPLAEPVVSAESKDVRWFPIDVLPHGCAPGFDEQFTGVLARVRSLPSR